METQNNKKAQMQGVKIAIISLAYLFISCSINQDLESQFETKIYKSNNNSTFLNLQSYHYDDKSTPSFSTHKINNIIYSNHGNNPLILDVLPGEFTISSGAIGKEWLKQLKATLKKGDSTVIKVYLKDDRSKFNH